MDEYISKHEAYKMMKDLEAAYIYPPVKEAYGTAARRIDQIPVADVLPVVHGHWEECKIRGTLTQSCSVCGSDCGVLYSYDFCPNCGARMDGDTNG